MTRSERAGLGVRCHSGWAAYVALGGRPQAPELLERGRVVLCDPGMKGSKQPYHEVKPMNLRAADEFIQTCRKASERQAEQAFSELKRRHGRVMACCLLDASGRRLPGLAEILGSHALIHAAEGEFYRNVVQAACTDAGMSVQRVRERDLEAVAECLPGTAENRRRRLEGFGKNVGPPWRQDEKMAALSAWLALAAHLTQKRL